MQIAVEIARETGTEKQAKRASIGSARVVCVSVLVSSTLSTASLCTILLTYRTRARHMEARRLWLRQRSLSDRHKKSMQKLQGFV